MTIRKRARILLICSATIAFAVAAGCTKEKKGDEGGKGGDVPPSGPVTVVPEGDNPGGQPKVDPGKTPVAPGPDILSKDILARTETAQSVQVKHVLLAWKDLKDVYQGQMDPRAAGRSREDAAKLATDILAKLKEDPKQIDALVKQHGEDPGAAGGDAYEVLADSPFVPEFKALSLRLKENEAGIVQTQFGYHVIERVPPPPPDPVASNDILARQPVTDKALIQHILVGWKDVPAAKQRPPDPRATAREKADADKLALEILKKVKAGGDMAKLMAQFSEDPGSAASGKPYEVQPATQFVQGFKNMALRLNMGEAGIVKTEFGWHIMKRVPPPPPDKLESADILARQPVTQTAKVKHILLSWNGNPRSQDPRAKERTRAQLDTLVKATVAKLKKGAKVEDLMKELSEDPGSAASGMSYDVDPNAGLVQPFKDLSLRLNKDEVGVVQTDFGFHIIKRVE